jgi:hypothetical protein
LAGERTPLLIVLVLTLLAKGGALLPGYSIDDYGATVDGPGALLGDVLRKGRAGHWLFLKAAVALQAEPNAARILFVSASIVAYAVFGLAVVRFWGVRGNGWLPVAAAGIIANHPYTCEIFTFRIGLPLAMLVMVLLSFLLFLASLPHLYLVGGGLTFALALSFYQIALHFAFMVFLLGAAIGLCRFLTDRPTSTTNQPESSWFDFWRLFGTRNVRLLSFILFGGFLYFLAGVLFGKLIGLKGGYFEILPLSSLPPRLSDATKTILRTFVRPNVLVPAAIQVTFALIVASFGIGLLWTVFRRPIRGSSFWVATGILLLAGCALMWSLGVFLFLQGFWPVPRSMAHVGIFWAGCLVLAASMPLPWVARGLSMAAAAVLISFVGVNEHILDDQWRLNMRDLFQANRIVTRLETLPGFDRTRRVAFVGKGVWYPIGLPRTEWGDMNISAFAPTWSQVHLLQEASGYDLQLSTDTQERAEADAYCAGAEPWPAQDSVVLRDSLAIICVGPPKSR